MSIDICQNIDFGLFFEKKMGFSIDISVFLW